MAKQNGSILDDLALYHWWVNVVLAAIVYLSMKYWIPTIEFQNTFYAGMAKIAPVLAPVIAGMILLAAAVSAFGSRRRG
jgi:restriction system protein